MHVARCVLAVWVHAFAGMIDTPVGSTQIQNNLASCRSQALILHDVNRFGKGLLCGSEGLGCAGLGGCLASLGGLWVKRVFLD